MLSEELVQFCKNTHPRMNKFGCCVINDHMYSSEFNSTDRGSIVKAMIVLKENNKLHPYYGPKMDFTAKLVRC